MATSRPSPGINRAAFKARNTSAPAPARPAPAPIVRPVAAPASPWRDSAEIILAVVLILGLILGGLLMIHFTRDSMAVGRALADQGKERSSLICKDGRIARGDGSVHDVVFADGVFVCTDWRTLQAVEMEEQQRGGGRR